MYIGFLYIPDVLADQIAASSAEWSGRAIPNIRKTGATEEPPAKTPATPPAAEQKSDPTTTILWIGALTSVGGLGIQYASYRNEAKRKR